MDKKFMMYGAVLAFLAVVAGAFGSHILKEHLDSNLLNTFETAVRYQMYHSLALILVALLVKMYESIWVTRAGWFFIAGILIFSGSLYLLCLTGYRWLGAFTPFGGISFLAGWVCLFIAARKHK